MVNPTPQATGAAEAATNAENRDAENTRGATSSNVRPEPAASPLVSILVPICNVQDFLPGCLDSLVNQTLRDIEIVAIDDGSTDESGAVLDDYAARDARIVAVHKQNSGYGDTMNQALALARAPWIAICEPDDYVEPIMCEHLLACAQLHGATDEPIDLVKASYTRITDAGSAHPVALPSPFHQAVHPPRQPFSIDECPVLLSAHPSIWTCLYRRAFLDEFGIRFKPIAGAGWADNPFFLETLIAARRIAYLDEPVYNYREFEDDSISHLRDWHIITDRWNDMQEVLERYDVHIPSILEAHACRGCAYLQMLSADFAQEPELVRAAKAMAQTLDHDIVCSSSFIPKEYKLAYGRYLPPDKRASLLAAWISLHIRSIVRKPTL